MQISARIIEVCRAEVLLELKAILGTCDYFWSCELYECKYIYVLTASIAKLSPKRRFYADEERQCVHCIFAAENNEPDDEAEEPVEFSGDPEDDEDAYGVEDLPTFPHLFLEMLQTVCMDGPVFELLTTAELKKQIKPDT